MPMSSPSIVLSSLRIMRMIASPYAHGRHETVKRTATFPFPGVALQLEGGHKVDGLTGAWEVTESERRLAELAGERAAEVTAKLQLAEVVAALR